VSRHFEYKINKQNFFYFVGGRKNDTIGKMNMEKKERGITIGMGGE
jgi:hypothetical protein